MDETLNIKESTYVSNYYNGTYAVWVDGEEVAVVTKYSLAILISSWYQNKLNQKTQ